VSERLSFQQTCKELGISPAELEDLVASREIAAMKDGDSIWFTRVAVEQYRERSGDPSILLTDDEINLLDDADIDFGIETGAASKSGVGSKSKADAKTEELSIDETVLGDDLEISARGSDDDLLEGNLLEDDLQLETDSLLDDTSMGMDATVVGDDTLFDTDVLSLESGDADTFDLDTAEETVLDADDMAGGSFLRGGGARPMQLKRKKSGAGMTAVLAINVLLLLLPLAVLMSMTYSRSLRDEVPLDRKTHQWIEGANVLRAVVEPLANLFR
jgi:hypothetical protein